MLLQEYSCKGYRDWEKFLKTGRKQIWFISSKKELQTDLPHLYTWLSDKADYLANDFQTTYGR